ncbi:MAG: SGNH/GDSL hydrolase family protein [Lentisphaeria bacterium]|nr:SGNH/GDSL hydrolase family protein [Lentisphaeria bacterium]
MGKTILFQGDSITDCGRTGSANPEVSLGTGYPFFISARLQADRLGDEPAVINRGISGNRVVDLYARWKIDALNLRPDVLSILIGVNDTWHEFMYDNGVEVPRYADFYRKLILWTLEKLPECRLVLCEPFVLETGVVTPAWVSEINRRRNVVKALADEYKTVFVPFQRLLSDAAKKAGDPARILGDGVHPTACGHQLMADAWLKAAAGVL